MFQSTRPRGARRIIIPAYNQHELFQSTRPRGARPERLGDTVRKLRFNPRAREGRDIMPDMRATRIRRFNPRAREGRDIMPDMRATRIRRFNPRAREGRDGCDCIRQDALGCFNPRAREGRDVDGLMPQPPIHMFQSTRPRGARPFTATSLLIFIFPGILRDSFFISVRPYSIIKEQFNICFNIHYLYFPRTSQQTDVC